MRTYIFLSCLLIAFNGLAQRNAVNAVLGDTSWILNHQRLPTNFDAEQDRITTHLSYVLGNLKATEGEGTETGNRETAIAHLEEYIEQGQYPSKFDYYPTRRPCFIDDNGTLCAVGYLVAQTAGLEEAQRINSLYRYNYIAEMDDPGLETWQQSIGLSMKELAMIQPSYGSPPEWTVYKDPRKEKYGLKNRYTDKVIAKAIYDSLIFQYNQPMYGNLQGLLLTGLARINHQWGAINSRGETVIPIEYNSISWIKNITEGQGITSIRIDTAAKYLQARTNSQTHVFNQLGEEMFSLSDITVAFRTHTFFIIETKGTQRFWNARKKEYVGNPYQRIESTYSNQPKGFKVLNKEGYGFVSAKGEELIPCKYKSLEALKMYWLGRDDNGMNLFSSTGQQIDIGLFDYAEFLDYSDESKLVVWGGSKRGLFDLLANRWLIDLDYDQIFSDNNGRIYVEKEGNKGYFDALGKVIVPAVYDYVNPLPQGYLVRQKGKMGIFKSRDQWTFPLVYDSIIQLNHGTIEGFAMLKSGKWKMIHADGKSLTEQEFTSFSKIRPNIYVVGNGSKLHFAHINGNELQINTSTSIQSWSYYVQSLIVYEQNGQFGLWNTYGDQWATEGKVTDPIYDEIIDHGLKNRGVFPVKYKARYGLINREGNFMIPATYQNVDHSHISVIYFKGNEGWYRYDYGRALQVQTERVNQLLDGRNK